MYKYIHCISGLQELFVNIIKKYEKAHTEKTVRASEFIIVPYAAIAVFDFAGCVLL